MSGKNVSPPPLPADVLARVIRVAATDGRLLLIIAGVFAFFSASIREAPGAIAGVLAAGAGALEMHGANRLRAADPGGLRWMIASQFGLLVVVIIYAAVRLTHLDTASMGQHITMEMEAQLDAAGLTRDDLLQTVRLLFQVGYGALIVATCAYQGGMMAFFHRRRAAVIQALQPDTEE
jgi:hypothetical protein